MKANRQCGVQALSEDPGGPGDEPLVGTLFAGRFRIESLLGLGGMGAVYLARHEVLGRSVAIKVIRRELVRDARAARRFRREARIASRLEHPNLTAVLDFGYSEEGEPYLVMEYVDGCTLADLIAREGPLPVPRAVEILAQIARAIAYAHASNVVHCDLKPQNVILTPADIVKITDFGLARTIEIESASDITLDGGYFGTPTYVSPEQCAGSPADPRSDIYSLGVLAYESLVGSPPFAGSTLQLMYAHLGMQPCAPSIASGRKDIPEDLDSAVLSCLAKRPADRFEDAALLANLIESSWHEPNTGCRRGTSHDRHAGGFTRGRDGEARGIKHAVQSFVNAQYASTVITSPLLRKAR